MQRRYGKSKPSDPRAPSITAGLAAGTNMHFGQPWLAQPDANPTINDHTDKSQLQV